MGLRFWRRVRVMPGVTLNFSLSNVSLSVGPPGARYTFSSRGDRATVGLPGSGLFYTVRDPFNRSGRSTPEPTGDGVEDAAVQERLNPGWFRRWRMPAEERALLDALRAVAGERVEAALSALQGAGEHPDRNWLEANLNMQERAFPAAIAAFERILARPDGLGERFSRLQLRPSLDFSVADGVMAHAEVGLDGVRLALAELYQGQGRHADAELLLRALREDVPEDVVVQAALVELLLDRDPVPPAVADEVVRITTPLENDSAIHAYLLRDKGRALMALGMPAAAVETLTRAYRRKKDRPAALLRQIRYDRALAYQALGQSRRARKELEAIYAAEPGFADVAGRLAVPT